jgi:hypothetical protein
LPIVSNHLKPSKVERKKFEKSPLALPLSSLTSSRHDRFFFSKVTTVLLEILDENGGTLVPAAGSGQAPGGGQAAGGGQAGGSGQAGGGGQQQGPQNNQRGRGSYKGRGRG